MSTHIKNLDEYLRKAAEIFPGINISSVFSLYGGEEPVPGKIYFSSQSSFLKNFFAGFQHRYFIHYTSLESFFEIVNSKKLRLYDLNKLNDPNEVKYALTALPQPLIENIEEYKRNLFSASFCKYNMNAGNDNFSHGRTYAREGRGVGIVFELTNPRDDWHNLYFGKVNYGLSNDRFNKLKEFTKFHVEFDKAFILFENVPKLFALMVMLRN